MMVKKVMSETDLPAGTYGIIIIDANNCQADSTVTLTQPDKISLVFEINITILS